ncbi:MAG TPA: LuxR C-terminal-related transcriptional regulator [Anaerolineales bacterium]
MADPLLGTKITMPPVRVETVQRTRLLEVLSGGFQNADGFNRQLTLVSAPAGYGKTTLISAWINSLHLSRSPGAKHEEVAIAWLSLDETDNEPTRFLSYIIAAIQKAHAGFGKATNKLLSSPQKPPDEIVLTVLVNELSGIASPLVLVLDDYHSIHTLPIHNYLNFLLEHQPAHLHLVIVSREDPPLLIPRLRVRNAVLEIRQEDLRFTAEEPRLFLKKVMGLKLTPEEISALERRTEGWIAGLQLAALSMHGLDDLSGFVRAFTGSSRFILDYLMEEVFERQSPEVKHFLLKTSILERLSGPLCNAVAGTNSSQEILEGLEHSNLFIISLDQSRDWFRYHRLFAELLRHRMRTVSNEEKSLHHRASQWYKENSFPSDAIHHAIAAQDWERAADLIIASNGELLKRGEVFTVIGWFRALPEEMLLSNPKLCFEYCWPLLLAGQFDVAGSLLDRLEESADGNPAFLGEVYAAQAYLARNLNDHPLMVEKSQKALGLLPKSSVTSRGIVALNLGLAYWHMGQMQAAENALAEAMDVGQATENTYALLTALIFIGRIHAVRGQLRKAAGYFERAIQQGSDIPINALAHLDMSILHYEWNRLEKSEEHLQKATALCELGHNHEFLAACRMWHIQMLIAQGNLSEAQDALESVQLLAPDKKLTDAITSRLDVLQVNLSLAKGESVAGWADKLGENVDYHSFYRFLGISKARVLPPVHAKGYLNGLTEIAKTNEWIYGLIAARVLQATMVETQEEALGFLTDALELGREGGFIRSFVDAGEKLVPLLHEAVRRGVSPDYGAQILDVIAKKVEAAGPDQSSLIEPLSGREIEVLRLVTAGMSNREIADTLVISPGTVKTHVHNVCGKLGARNRTEATRRAKELGLV